MFIAASWLQHQQAAALECLLEENPLHVPTQQAWERVSARVRRILYFVSETSFCGSFAGDSSLRASPNYANFPPTMADDDDCAGGATLLSPLLDLVFKCLMEDERLLRSMLEAVLGLRNIETLEILNPGLPADVLTGKLIVLDVRVRLSDGSVADIEMQGRAHTGFSSRILLYWARLYNGQIGAGDDYARLRPARIICWLNDTLIKNESFHNTYQVRNVEDGSPWPSQDLEIHTLELPKFSPRPTTTPQSLFRWARFFSSKNRQDFQDLAQEDPIMAIAKSNLERLSADPKTVELARSREENLRALGHWAACEREEGREEGTANTLLKLICLKFNSVDTETENRIRAATPAQLDELTSAILTSNSLAELLSRLD